MQACALCVFCVAGGTVAALGHWVGDAHRTPVNMCHLVGPVPVADVLFRWVDMVVVDGILPQTKADSKKK